MVHIIDECSFVIMAGSTRRYLFNLVPVVQYVSDNTDLFMCPHVQIYVCVCVTVDG